MFVALRKRAPGFLLLHFCQRMRRRPQFLLAHDLFGLRTVAGLALFVQGHLLTDEAKQARGQAGHFGGFGGWGHETRCRAGPRSIHVNVAGRVPKSAEPLLSYG